MIGGIAKIILLPDGIKDVNELLVKHGPGSKEIIEGLVKDAKTALQLDIDRFPKDPGQYSEDRMKDLVGRIQALQPLLRDRYIEQLAKRLGKAKG